MIIMLQIILINSQEELAGINANNEFEYAINQDFNVQLIDSDLISVFNGFLSGARHIIRIEQIVDNFQFIVTSEAIIQDITIQITIDILATDSFSLVKSSRRSQIKNIYFTLKTKNVLNDIKISFFENFINSDISSSFFELDASLTKIQKQNFTIIYNAPKSKISNINIQQDLYNVQFATCFYLVEDADHLIITQNVIQCKTVNGVAYSSIGTINNINIIQTIGQISFNIGVAQQLQGQASSIHIYMKIAQNDDIFTILAITQTLQAILNSFDLELEIIIDSAKEQSNIQMFSSAAEVVLISDISVQIRLYVFESLLKVSFFGDKCKSQEFKNISIQMIQQSGDLPQQLIQLAEDIEKSIFSNLYFQFESSADSYLGKQSYYGICNKAVDVTLQNIVIIQTGIIKNVNSQFQLFGLFNQASLVQIVNLSIRFQCIFESQDRNNDNIFAGLGQTIIDSTLTNIIVFISLQSKPQLQSYFGISKILKNTTLQVLNMFGEIKLDNINSIHGISEEINNCTIMHLMINVFYQAINTPDCYILGKEVTETKLQYIVELTIKQECKKGVKLQKELLDSDISNTAILAGNGKGLITFQPDDLQIGSFANQYIITGQWKAHPKYNSKFIYLANLFTTSTTSYIEILDTPPFPFMQTANGSIYLKNQRRICLKNCAQLFNGDVITCGLGFMGLECTTYSCGPNFCKNSGVCDSTSGCKCLPGKYGKTCQHDFCNTCIGDMCEKPIKHSLPVCAGDQITTCQNGINADNFCVCKSGYFTKKRPCGSFKCKTDRDCSDQKCINGNCNCRPTLGGLSCQYCIGNDVSCKQQCVSGDCQFGNGCIYLEGISGDYQCSNCIDNRISPRCMDCKVGFIKVVNSCFSKCNTCKTGVCYFLDKCISKDPALCEYGCISCSIGVSGDKCNICQVNYQFYNYNCYQILDQDVTFGVCFTIDGKNKCLSCVVGYILYKDQCVLKCSKESCQYGTCQEDQTCLCKDFFEGPSCASCLKGTVFFDGLCQQECGDCNGQCFYTKESILTCITCLDGYMGTDCMQCQEGFVFENSQCLQICDTCNGKDCVVQLRIEICFGACFTGYIGDSCQVCDAPNGYFPVLSWCYQKCDTCVYGECFNTESGDVICTSCYDNRVGTQCNNCLDGYILAMEKCQKQVTEDKCFLVDVDLICIGCRPGKVLADATCHDVCLYPSCQGTCYLTDVSFICLDCYNGFLLVDQKCYEQTENPKGDCYIKSEEIICICYPGFSGVDCSSCIGIIQNERCYIRDGSITSGTCYKDALDAMDKFCQTCQYNYQLPLCQECSPGYEIDLVAMTCSVCATGYLDSNLLPPDQLSQVGPDRCIAKCVSCLNGDCYYQGDAIFCISCKNGYDPSTACQTCAPGYLQFGAYCIVYGVAGCGETEFGEKYCLQCEDNLKSFNCTQCSLNSYIPECYIHSDINKGDCYIQGSSVICTDEICLAHILESNDCTKCQSEFLLYNGSCWKGVPPQSNKLRGDCYTSEKGIYCKTCQTNWSGNKCSRCSDDYISCMCVFEAFHQCCCPIIYDQNGICYRNQLNKVICRQCFSGYQLVDNTCVIKTINTRMLILWLLLIIIIIIIVIIILIIYSRMSPSDKQQLLVRYKKIVKSMSSRLMFFILAQLLSVIIAIQDVYINNFGMQNTVNIFSMVPILCLFFFSSVPDKNIFFYNKQSHYYLFVLIAMLELCFNYIQFDGVPIFLQNFGEETYKLAGPPVTLFLTVFFGAMKFTKQQKISIFVGITLPLFLQFLSAITEFNSSGYVSDASRGSVIYGQILIGIAILIIGVKFYLYEIILIKYGEMGSINRLAISALLVNAFVGCINPSQMIDAILDYRIFTFSIITQLLFNVINIIVMMHLSAVEFSINLISSAIWAIFISSVGNYHHASQNYYAESYTSIILNTISLIVLLLCLIYFAIHNSQWYSQANEKLKKEVKIVTGVKAFWKSRFLQRKQFTRAASQQQNSVLDPTENMKALKIYDQLKRSQTNVTMELKNTQSDSSLISPAPIPKSHSIFPNDKGGSSLKRVVTCNKNTNVLCYVQPIRTDTVQQLIIANNEAQNSMQEDSAMLTFDQIGQKLKDMLGVEKDELVW